MRESIHPQPMAQPKALYFLFLIELWERFGFYIMRGLLVLYLTQFFLLSDHQSFMLFGTFTALLWFTPMLGGYVADRILGYRRTMIIGAFGFIIGYGLLVIPSMTAMYWGLSFILLGNGFFKPNVASLMGSLYQGSDDPRRQGGFTIYYMGINIGSLLAGLSSGLIVLYWGWHAAFATASAGLIIGLILFVSGQELLGQRGKATPEHYLHRRLGSLVRYTHLVYGAAVAIVIIGYFLLHNVVLADWTIAILGAAFIAVFIASALRRPAVERNRLLACLCLILFSVVFWVLYQQAPMTVNLFTERNVDRHWLGWDFPTVAYQSLNPFFIIVLTPFFSTLVESSQSAHTCLFNYAEIYRSDFFNCLWVFSVSRCMFLFFTCRHCILVVGCV